MAEGSESPKQDVVEQVLREANETAAPSPSGPPPGSTSSEPPSSPVLRQEEIEALLNQNAAAAPAARAAVAAAQARATRGSGQPAAAEPAAGRIASGDIEFLLNQAEQALASVESPARDTSADGAVPFHLADFSGAAPTTENATLDLIRDVDLDLRIELGRTQMYLEDVLKLGKGAVVPLDKLAGDPVDIYANGRLIARGEVLILNDNFCVRVAELVAGDNPAPTH